MKYLKMLLLIALPFMVLVDDLEAKKKTKKTKSRKNSKNKKKKNTVNKKNSIKISNIKTSNPEKIKEIKEALREPSIDQKNPEIIIAKEAITKAEEILKNPKLSEEKKDALVSEQITTAEKIIDKTSDKKEDIAKEIQDEPNKKIDISNEKSKNGDTPLLAIESEDAFNQKNKIIEIAKNNSEIKDVSDVFANIGIPYVNPDKKINELLKIYHPDKTNDPKLKKEYKEITIFLIKMKDKIKNGNKEGKSTEEKNKTDLLTIEPEDATNAKKRADAANIIQKKFREMQGRKETVKIIQNQAATEIQDEPNKKTDISKEKENETAAPVINEAKQTNTNATKKEIIDLKESRSQLESKLNNTSKIVAKKGSLEAPEKAAPEKIETNRKFKEADDISDKSNKEAFVKVKNGDDLKKIIPGYDLQKHKENAAGTGPLHSLEITQKGSDFIVREYGDAVLSKNTVFIIDQSNDGSGHWTPIKKGYSITDKNLVKDVNYMLIDGTYIVFKK